MLATNNTSTLEPGPITAISRSLPLLVQLPDAMEDFLLEQGFLPTILGERRSNSRLRVRAMATRHSDFVPVFVLKREPVAKVLMKDLSRSGIGLLSHEQLWPGETFWLELMNRQLHVRVVRCRKLGPACYEVGGTVTTVSSP